MARGYSANRSSSSRPTLKAKRHRSISIQKLRESIDRSSSSASKNEAPQSEGKAIERKPLRKVITSLRFGKGPSGDEAAVQTPISKEDTLTHTPSNVFIAQKLAKDHMDDLEASEDEENTTRRPLVMTKYKAAGKLVDEVLDLVSGLCVIGATTKDLCAKGDEELKKRVKGVFGKAKDGEGKKLCRGLAYPCNVSVNNVLCNHSPIHAAEGVTLKAGDVVKIHLGCHVDGFPVTAARTIIVPAIQSGESEEAALAVPQSVCDAVEASRVALDSMIHSMRPGVEGADITDLIARVGSHFEVEAVEGVLSTRTKRWLIDSMDAIICRRVTKEDPQQDVDNVTIEPFQVWTLDVAFTNSPTYKMQTTTEQSNIFRKNELESLQDHRIPSAAEFLREINTEFFCFPFHSAHASNPIKARMGIAVLKKAGLLDEFCALQCKPKYVTTRFSATVVVTDKRMNILCGAPPIRIEYGATNPKPLPADIAALVNEPLVFAASDKAAEKKPKKKARVDPSATTAVNESE